MNTINQFFGLAMMIIIGFAIIVFYIRNRTIILANQLNGRLTELIAATRELARSQGISEGIASERAAHPHDN